MKQNRTYKGNTGAGMRKLMAATTSAVMTTDWKSRYFVLPVGGASLQYYTHKPSGEDGHQPEAHVPEEGAEKSSK